MENNEKSRAAIKVTPYREMKNWVQFEFPDEEQYLQFLELFRELKLNHLFNEAKMKIQLDSIQVLEFLFSQVPNMVANPNSHLTHIEFPPSPSDVGMVIFSPHKYKNCTA